MNSVAISEVSHVLFIGVGGIGMSGLARLFLHEGKSVSGSDRAPSALTSALEAEGVTFYASQVPENITDDVDLVVYTEAMAHDHPELAHARERGITCINYFEGLGLVANQYYLIAVAGSHGKTTTTAMLIDIAEAAGFDPTAIVGSLRASTKSNYRAGKSKYFIVEACEYKRDFLTLTPDVLVITNLELEHVDYYKSLADVQDAFRTLALRVPEDGAIICATRDVNLAPVLEGVSAKVVDYHSFADPLLELQVPGMHNVLNAAAARAAADFVGVESVVAREALTNFKGTWRRFEYKGELNGAPVYDDYCHHPTEIRATVRGARDKYPGKKVTLAFQPHTYSRLHELFEDFAEALDEADEVYLAPAYAAREENVYGTSSEKLAERARERGHKKVIAYASLEDIAEALKVSTSGDSVILIMGAGDIPKLTAQLFA